MSVSLLVLAAKAQEGVEVLLHERFEGSTSGSIHGGVRFVADVVGYGGMEVENQFSAQFDGQPQTAICVAPEMRLDAPEFTVEAFVKPGAATVYAAIAGDWDELGDQRAWALVLCPGNGLRFDVMPDGKFHAGNALITRQRLLRSGHWHHVAAVSDRNLSRVYVNGRLVAEKQRAVPGLFPRSTGVGPEQVVGQAAVKGDVPGLRER